MISTTASRTARPRPCRGVVTASLALLALLAPLTARAQTTDPQLAQSLFDQARQLMAAQKYKEACPLLAESQRLDPGGGTLLNLAMCHEAEGKTATAWTEFNAALSIAIKDGRKGRESIARQHIRALEPKLCHVTVTVPSTSEADGLLVSLDGLPLARPAWGIAASVDPGSHKVEASAPGRRGWSVLVVMGSAGEARTVVVPPLSIDASQGASSCPEDFEWNGATCIRSSAGPAVPPPAITPAQPVITPPPPPPSNPPPPVDYGPIKVPSTSPLRYTVGALSLASLGASLVTGVLAWSDHNTVNDHCDVDRQYCDSADDISKQSASRTLAWVSTITLGVGVVGSAAYLFWPSQTKTIVTPAPVVGGMALVVQGAL
jgi:hypothetical protein